jgi:ankyrin repeat protein
MKLIRKIALFQFGFTPIHYAVYARNIEAILLLTSRGSKVTLNSLVRQIIYQ